MNPFEEIHRTLDRVAALQEKSAKEFAEWREASERELAELRASIKRIGRKLGNIGMNNGYFVEELFYSILRVNPRLGDQTYDLVRRNIDDPNTRSQRRCGIRYFAILTTEVPYALSVVPKICVHL